MIIEISSFIFMLISLFVLKGLMFYISYKKHKNDRFKERKETLEKYEKGE